MCSKPKETKIEKADPVAAPPPADAKPLAPVLNNETKDSDASKANTKRKGRAALTIPLRVPNTGINLPR